MPFTRRDLLAGSLLSPALGAAPQDPPPRAMPTRPLGKTGERVPVLSLGTHPLGTLPADEDAVPIIERAFERGVRYFDTAPSYSGHRAERRLAQALRGKRDEVLIATKSYQLPKQKALDELDASLQALGTDRVDVFQIHAIGDDGDRRRKLDPDDGVLAAALAAKRQGKCRFIGVTGHQDPEVMARALEDHAFDTLLVPVNCADPLWLSFVEHTLPVAKRLGVGVIAMKVFAAGRLVAGDEPRAKVASCVRYALSQDIATAIVGAKSVAELEADLAAARVFEPMNRDESEALVASLEPHPGNSLEWYKKPPR